MFFFFLFGLYEILGYKILFWDVAPLKLGLRLFILLDMRLLGFYFRVALPFPPLANTIGSQDRKFLRFENLISLRKNRIDSNGSLKSLHLTFRR